MTPAQLSHLAEQADFAAGFYAVTNPSAARRFKEAAATAQQLSAQLERQEQIARLRAELADIRGRLTRLRAPEPRLEGDRSERPGHLDSVVVETAP